MSVFLSFYPLKYKFKFSLCSNSFQLRGGGIGEILQTVQLWEWHSFKKLLAWRPAQGHSCGTVFLRSRLREPPGWIRPLCAMTSQYPFLVQLKKLLGTVRSIIFPVMINWTLGFNLRIQFKEDSSPFVSVNRKKQGTLKGSETYNLGAIRQTLALLGKEVKGKPTNNNNNREEQKRAVLLVSVPRASTFFLQISFPFHTRVLLHKTPAKPQRIHASVMPLFMHTVSCSLWEAE